MNRRSVLKGVAAGTIGLPVALRLLGGRGQAQTATATVSGEQYNWKMVTTWPPGFPILGEGCQMLADLCREMSGGRLNITVYGGGELVPALEAFDAVRQGAAEVGSGAAYYWAGKLPAAQFFAGFPFGLNAQQMNAWLIAGGGMELWRKLYADVGLVPFAGGNTGVQMGGWFNREIRGIADFRGLKMRMPGLGGRVLERLGGTPVLLPGGEIYTGLERGILDATEWVGPYHDYVMGFHEIARYYYYPGWHEPGTSFEFFVNRDKYESLPADLQRIFEVATHYINLYTLSAFESKNAEYLARLQQVPTLSIRPYPPEVLDRARRAAAEVMEEYAATDAITGEVYDSIQRFRQQAKPWNEITEQWFYDSLS
ncbi:TRAP-type mannitol/chloroaromatic compound transport system substrate-binding protein [Lewinella marina]|uniref:ABC transporter substrate-binding protein n=1 Tax=Neolewinella marina TaxID=438751 RepID=A0A2G0CHB3_9BACT|nr:TRAP transporter substrate-binding protein [Neolewinella marina]NJB86147.1 TRAP-type mannitol/chloroaromatic compound transport system substrate-binding protein [Neolewinella marina]PHK99375.1 ABC transporter substrate-binding protein [Neolewinella marina]